jgi:PAS domain S-box-containing protein
MAQGSRWVRVPLLTFALLSSGALAPDTAPPGMLIGANSVQTLWSEHHEFVLLALGVFVALLALIAALVAQHRRRQRAETALRRTEDRNSAILRAIPDLMFVLSPDGVYLDYNAPNSAALFVPPDQFLGKHIRDVMPAELAESFEPLLSKVMTAEQPISLNYVLPIGGSERHFEARLVKCDNDTIVSIVRDVTDTRQASEALHHTRAELAQAARVRSLGELATGVAHEVSQPLSAMITNARAGIRRIDNSCQTDEIRRVLQDIVSDGLRATGVITRIRGLIKHTPMRLARLDVNHVIDEVVGLSGPMLRQHHITLEIERRPHLAAVTGDRIQLQQVLLNLVINATDAMRNVTGRRRVLAIRIDQRDEYVTVRVHDSGAGLPEADVRRIFTPFFSTKPDGMGVGLSISRSIVEAHGGRLNLASNSPEGAIFELDLPIAAKS